MSEHRAQISAQKRICALLECILQARDELDRINRQIGILDEMKPTIHEFLKVTRELRQLKTEEGAER